MPGALLLHNIVSWRGPDFDGLPCTPANIRALPSAESDPFIEKVVNEIGTRNKKRESPNPKSPATTSTSASAGEAGSRMNGKAGARAQNRRRTVGSRYWTRDPIRLDAGTDRTIRP